MRVGRPRTALHHQVSIRVDGKHGEAEELLPAFCVAPLRVNAGDAHRHVAGLVDAPAHRLAGLIAGLEDALGRHDAPLAAAPGVSKAGQGGYRLGPRVVGAPAKGDFFGEVGQ